VICNGGMVGCHGPCTVTETPLAQQDGGCTIACRGGGPPNPTIDDAGRSTCQ
jgi:hypothetical protein